MTQWQRRMPAAVLGCFSAAGPFASSERDPNMLAFTNDTGQLRTFDTRGALDLSNPFFQELGTNGRACVTCHQPGDAWSITPAHIRARFDASKGTDPLFSTNDGSNCEGAVSRSLAELEKAFSLLLTRGLIRVGLDLPAGAEFAIDEVKDPYQCGSASTDGSFYRRPAPAMNLRFATAVMWDGRESSASSTIVEDLVRQAKNATLGHAQAAQGLSDEQARAIVEFETSLFGAQARDRLAGELNARGAEGGPVALSRQQFFQGINDPVGLNPTDAAFDPDVFKIFDAWSTISSTDPLAAARQSVARGQNLFNRRTFEISGVSGLNNETFASGVTVPASFTGTCTICHNSPNAGNHSVKAPLDIGLSDPARAPYLPVYKLRNRSTNAIVETTDPGRAMITGKWADIGKFRGPILRGLAARAPYFHNGSAATLEEVVEFYDTRFKIGLEAQDKADLVAFLRAL
jgi:cytochrome c peroxidase